MMSVLSPSGRIGRQTYWLTGLALFGVYIVMSIIVGTAWALSVETDGQGHITKFGLPAIIALIVAGVVWLLCCWIGLVNGIKRNHDHARSGVFLLLAFVPMANAWLLVEMGFVPGTPGPNEFGPDPLPPRITTYYQNVAAPRPVP